MRNGEHNLDPIEAAWQELGEAERAGVFRRTQPVRTATASSAAQPRVARPAWRSARVMVALAAALGLAVGVWGSMFYWQIGRLRERAAGLGNMVASVDPASPASVASFVECLSGPSEARLAADCVPFDRDGNGRVDLREVSALQLACVGRSQ